MPTGRLADGRFEVGARAQLPQPGPTPTTRARSMQQTPARSAGAQPRERRAGDAPANERAAYHAVRALIHAGEVCRRRD